MGRAILLSHKHTRAWYASAKAEFLSCARVSCERTSQLAHLIMEHDSLVSAATSVLLERDAFSKKALTDAIVRDWNDGALVAYRPDGADLSAPEQPSRDDRVCIIAPRDMPKLGKGGTLASRQVCSGLARLCVVMQTAPNWCSKGPTLLLRRSSTASYI